MTNDVSTTDSQCPWTAKGKEKLSNDANVNIPIQKLSLKHDYFYTQTESWRYFSVFSVYDKLSELILNERYLFIQ